MGHGRINRVRKESNFVMMDKGFLQNPELSAKAKGVLAYILSLPDDWILFKSELVKHFTDGRDSLRGALKELEQHGYLTQEEVRDERGRIKHHNVTVYELPNHCGFTATGLPQRITRSGKPATTNNDLTKNNLTKNDLTNTTTGSSQKIIVEHYQNNYGNIPSLVSRAIDKFLEQGMEPDLIVRAIDIAIERGKKWDYASGILANLRDHQGIKTLSDFEALRKKGANNHATSGRRNGRTTHESGGQSETPRDYLAEREAELRAKGEWKDFDDSELDF